MQNSTSFLNNFSLPFRQSYFKTILTQTKFLHFFKNQRQFAQEFLKIYRKLDLKKNKVFFEAACDGDGRYRISVEISSFELTIMKIYDFNHYRKYFNCGILQQSARIEPKF